MPTPSKPTRPTYGSPEADRVEREIVRRLETKLSWAQSKNQRLCVVDIAIAAQRIAERYSEFLPER